jgi:hypothetical protein
MAFHEGIEMYTIDGVWVKNSGTAIYLSDENGRMKDLYVIYCAYTLIAGDWLRLSSFGIFQRG